MRFIRRFGTYFPYSTNRVILEESMLISDVMYHTPGESGAFNYIGVSDDLDCLGLVSSNPGAVDIEPLLVGTSVSFIQV